jgi:hypothetical protein
MERRRLSGEDAYSFLLVHSVKFLQKNCLVKKIHLRYNV